MSSDERTRFEALPLFDDAVALRRADSLGEGGRAGRRRIDRLDGGGAAGRRRRGLLRS